jgi:hypothetical protein
MQRVDAQEEEEENARYSNLFVVIDIQIAINSHPGFARRYFVLDKEGVLSYSFQPGHNIRDHVMLQQAAVSTIPGRKDIHVDGENTTFHIKCLSTEDFNTWMAAIRYAVYLLELSRRWINPSVVLLPRRPRTVLKASRDALVWATLTKG